MKDSDLMKNKRECVRKLHFLLNHGRGFKDLSSSIIPEALVAFL